MTAILVVTIGALAALSILDSPRVRSSEGFFPGLSETGRAPGLWPLVFSAVSTLDSTLASASKLWVVDMGMAKSTPTNGGIAMAAFMAGGLALLFLGPDDLFAAVAISGTAALFLAPVVFFCIWGGMRVPR